NPYTEESAQIFLARTLDQQASGRGLWWAVADPETDLVLANVGFPRFGREEAELGYWTHPDARGRGVITRAARLAVRHAFVDEEVLADRLSLDSPHGEAWRCLRCGSYALGEPAGRGAAEEAPIVLRGKALKDAAILRFLAAERFLRGLFLVALAYGIVRFDGS